MSARSHPDRPGAGQPGADGRGFVPPYARMALSLYPPRWRERYGAEYAALLSDLTAEMSAAPARASRPRWPARARFLASIVAGALDARLHPSLAGGRRTVPDRVRGAVATAACTIIAFCLAGAGFQKMTESPALAAARHQHAAVGASFDVLVAAAVLAGLAVAAGGLPIVASIVRQAISGRRADLTGLLLVPPATVLSWLAAVIIAIRAAGHARVHSAPSLTAVAVITILGLGAAAGCAFAAVALLRRAGLPPSLLRAQVIPMAVLTVAMATVTGAAVSWGLALRSASPALFHSDNGVAATAMPPSWIGDVALLVIVTVVTAAATARAARAGAGQT